MTGILLMKKSTAGFVKSVFFIFLSLSFHDAFAEESISPEKKGFTSIPFTNPPSQRQWRLGFRPSAGFDMIEIPALKANCEECNRISGQAWPPEKIENLDSGKQNALALPFDMNSSLNRDLVNPEKWYLTDLKGNTRETSVNRLASVFSQVSSGCCYMTTELLGVKESIELDTCGPVPGNLFVAFTAKPDPVSVMRRTGAARKQFTNTGEKIPVEYVNALDSPVLRQALGDRHRIFKKELHEVSIQDFEACLDRKKGVEKLNLTVWISEEYTSAFAVYRKDEKNQVPVAAYFKSRQAYNDNFRPKVEAAFDFEGDGADELIMSVSYYEGNAFRVFGIRDGKITELYESGYYGL